MYYFRFFIPIITLICVRLNATNYYVDYENGDDQNDGLSQLTPWKHSPGDNNATGIPNGLTLKPGDIVLFKGGVRYCGELRLHIEGTKDNPIIYKGDGWGNEKAVMDGADFLESVWIQCLSAAECSENANYNNIYYNAVPDDFDFFSGFYEDGEFLWFSQDPNPDERYNYDNIGSFFEIPLGTSFSETSLTDTNYFIQSNADYWNGSYIIAWHIPNITTPHPVLSFDPSTHTITFEELGGGGIYTDRSSYYAMLNHPALIDEPGEYALDTLNNRVYLWPLNSDNPNNHTYSTRSRLTGINFYRSKNLIIEGFEVRNYTMGIRNQYNEAENVIIRNNHVKNLRSNNWYAVQINGKNVIVENNTIEDCIRSVGILVAGENQIIRNNYVKNTSRQGIWFMGVKHGSIINNTVTDIRGTHSNGISAYLYNEDILIAGNKVLNSNISLTFHGDRDLPDHHMNLTVYNNYFENRCHSWGKNARDIKIINNVFQEGLFFASTDTITFSVNNVFHSGGDADFNRHNIYTEFGWWQRDRYGWSLQEGEKDWTEKDINEIFVDIENEDIHIVPESPARDSGISPLPYLPVDLFPEYNFKQDLFGNPRPQGIGWDIGCHEYKDGTTSFSPCALDDIHIPVYPNPTDGMVNIEFPNHCYVKLYDLSGKLMISTQEKELDLSRLSGGIYIIRITTSRENCVVKLMKR